MLLLFVHGFQGSRESFHNFPSDLQSNLPFNVETMHYEYEAGEYDEKVKFLVEKIQKLQQKFDRIVLIAHSMGGPISVDAANRTFVTGVISFDSPYFGLHHNVLAQQGLEKATGFVSKLGSFVAPSEKSSFTAFGLGAFALAATAIAYTSSPVVKNAVDKEITRSTSLVDNSLKFLGPLWDVKDQMSRFEKLETFGLYFRGLYVELDGNTFISPPSKWQNMFTVHKMHGHESVIDCHICLFDSKKDAKSYAIILGKTLEWIKECKNIEY